MRNCYLVPVICAVLISTQGAVSGQDGDASGVFGAVRAGAKSYVEAFDRGDAAAVAAFWSDDGYYADQSGYRVQGAAAIEKAFAEYFAKRPGAKLNVKIESLFLPQEDMVVEVGDSVVTFADNKSSEAARYKAIHRKQDGKWRMVSVQEGPPLPPSNYSQLKDLEWLIGSWVDEQILDNQQKLVVHTQARWSVNRNFIIRTFTETLDNRVTMTATQRIGWYAPANQVRSWTFDSAGGISVGIWTGKGDQWVVKNELIKRDGKLLVETESVSIDDVNTQNWTLSDRSLDQQPLPDLAIAVHRVQVKRPTVAKSADNK